MNQRPAHKDFCVRRDRVGDEGGVSVRGERAPRDIIRGAFGAFDRRLGISWSAVLKVRC